MAGSRSWVGVAPSWWGRGCPPGRPPAQPVSRTPECVGAERDTHTPDDLDGRSSSGLGTASPSARGRGTVDRVRGVDPLWGVSGPRDGGSPGATRRPLASGGPVGRRSSGGSRTCARRGRYFPHPRPAGRGWNASENDTAGCGTTPGGSSPRDGVGGPERDGDRARYRHDRRSLGLNPTVNAVHATDAKTVPHPHTRAYVRHAKVWENTVHSVHRIRYSCRDAGTCDAVNGVSDDTCSSQRNVLFRNNHRYIR